MYRYFFFVLIFLSQFILAAESNSGGISGKVVDSRNQLPLIGANIYIEANSAGAATNLDGEFNITNLPAGSYNIKFSYVGYAPATKTDIIVKPGRITYVNIELTEESFQLENVTVNAGYFSEDELNTINAVSFSSEEIRRAPGSAGDISRILFSLPSIAKINDNSNSLIVRGGSPIENSFYVDNIEIPNINHYPTQGSSDGPIGILNVDFIDDVTFYSGGFSTAYGDRMSSVMDIKFREGNRSNNNSQIVMSFAGMNALTEGPLGATGNYMVAVNKSYLDLIFKAIDESGTVPEYGDFQTKISFDLDLNNKISFIDILAIDYIDNKYDNAYENGEWVYGTAKLISNTGGINWRHIWGKSGYSQTSLSSTYTSWDNTFSRTKTRATLLDNFSDEISTTLRNINHFSFGNSTNFQFGFEVKQITNKYNIDFGVFQDEFGNITDGKHVDKKLNSVNSALFAEVNQNLLSNLSFNFGGRIDYYDYTGVALFSPRFGLNYMLTDKISINTRWGIFYQNIPANILVQDNSFKNLATPKSEHRIIGLEYLIAPETKVTLEVFDKLYTNFPVDPRQPSVFLFDETVRNHVFLEHKNLVDNGEASSRGFEVVVQKKLAKEFYGLISGSYSKAKYKALDGVTRDRIYDNQYNFAIEGGYKPNSSWEFSLRWIYAGGRPYTPIDAAASAAVGNEIIQKDKINTERLPAYHSLNLRVDKRYHFDSSNLIVYLSIWNAYGRENVSGYYWDEVNNEIKSETGWGTLPVLGLEWEF